MSGFGSGLGWGSKHRGVKRTTTTFFGVGEGGIDPGPGYPVGRAVFPAGEGATEQGLPRGESGNGACCHPNTTW
jgi:hypothetical protein